MRALVVNKGMAIRIEIFTSIYSFLAVVICSRPQGVLSYISREKTTSTSERPKIRALLANRVG